MRQYTRGRSTGEKCRVAGAIRKQRLWKRKALEETYRPRVIENEGKQINVRKLISSVIADNEGNDIRKWSIFSGRPMLLHSHEAMWLSTVWPAIRGSHFSAHRLSVSFLGEDDPGFYISQTNLQEMGQQYSRLLFGHGDRQVTDRFVEW